MMPKTVAYKLHKVRDPYCTICLEFLGGQGSLVSPYRCNCGTYEYDWHENKLKIVLAKQ